VLLERAKFDKARLTTEKALKLYPGSYEAQELIKRIDSTQEEYIAEQERTKKEEEVLKGEEEKARRDMKEEETAMALEEKQLKEKNLKQSVTQIAGFLAEKVGSTRVNVKMVKKNYIWILVVLLTGFVILSMTGNKIKNVLFGRGKEVTKEMVEFEDTVPVKVYKVKRMDFRDTLPVMGRIEGFKEIELRFSGEGVIESFNFEEGERILEGDIIASLDQKEALLKLKYASLDLEKSKRLYDLGGVAKIQVDQKKLEYESAKRDLEKTNIYANSDGYLGSKEKNTGAYVNSQDKIGLFVDLSEVYAAFDVIEEDSHKVELGQSAEIFIDAYAGETFTGTLDTISPMIQGRTRTQKVKIELPNDEDMFKPGMFARAIINTYEKQDALVIPASAFKKEENKTFVYVVHPDTEEEEEEGAEGEDIGTVEQREIKIEYLTHDMAEVGEGLEEGELIIRELHQEFKDKEKVEITEIQETIF